MLKVTISGIGESASFGNEGASFGNEGASATAKAEWVQARGAGLSGQAASVIPVGGTAAPNDIQLTRHATSFYDNDTTSERFVAATFNLINRKSTAFNNLTFYAVDVPGITQGGTGIAAMVKATGAAITDEARFREFRPTHAIRPKGAGLLVNSDNADLQFFTGAEVDNSDPGNLGIKQQAIALGILPATATVLEYGFVARNNLGGRDIAARNVNTTGAEDCTIEACKGNITLAYKFPKVLPRQENPFGFSIYFIVANETLPYVSQSLEEQPLNLNTIAGLDNTSGFSQSRVLFGSNASWASNSNNLCQVKTAAPTALSPYTVLLPSTGGAGSLDPCFDTDGKVTTNFGTGSQIITSIAIQKDGKILAAGVSFGITTDIAVARYNPDGTLDTTFDTDGMLTTSSGSGTDVAFSMVIQSDGKIVVVGFSGSIGIEDFALVRYNSDGSLDTTFDTDGKVTTAFGSSTDRAYSVAIQSDGKIVVAGYSYNGGNTDFAVARYNSNGTLDTGFDSDGRVTTAFGWSYDEAYSLAIQSDGKIVVAGHSDVNTDPFILPNYTFALARYNPDGSLDTSFGPGGKVTTDFSSTSYDIAYSVALQSDGKIVLGGCTDCYGNSDFAIARYNPSGTLDASFDSDGKVTTAIGSDNDIASFLALESDGKIVVAGCTDCLGNFDFAMARYNPSGTLDTSFDSDGKVTTAIGSSHDRTLSVALQSDGKIVLGGCRDCFDDSDFALARYNP